MSIIYQNVSKTITILDIPQSMSEAQYLSPFQSASLPNSQLPDEPEAADEKKGEKRRDILSSPPLETPYPSLEPKSKKAKERLGVGNESVEELILVRWLELALEEMATFSGPWCLPRILFPAFPSPRKRKGDGLEKDDSPSSLYKSFGGVSLDERVIPEVVSLHNAGLGVLKLDREGEKKAFIPPKATVLHGEIGAVLTSGRLDAAPKFDLIVLDPPWPNRSARRKGSYSISDGVHGIQDLLTNIPISAMVAPGGMVGVWVTNKAAFRDLLLSPCGIFDAWCIELVEEWVWVKTTIHGVPICALDSAWRKPYEILLIGRPKADFSAGFGKSDEARGQVKRRVIFGVSDLHSRKPNLRGLFEQVMGEEREGEERKGREGYEALEMFARHCTAGWWSWGDEVLKFQGEEYWV